MKNLLYTTISILLMSCLPTDLAAKTDLDSFVSDQPKDQNTPAIQYVVVSPSEVLYNGAFGQLDIQSKVRINRSTQMMAYSMTKTVIAIITLKMHELGQINVTDKVFKYLPELPYSSKLRIEHLLSQSSGIPNPIPLRWAHLRDDHAEFDEGKAYRIRIGENPKLDFEPGEKYAYSNLSYVVLGRVLEKASQTSLTALLKKWVLDPLAISESQMGFEYSGDYSYASGYLRRWSFINFLKYFVIDDRFYSDYEDGWLRINSHAVDFRAMGGLFTNAQTLAAVLQDLLKEDSKLLSKNSKSLLTCAAQSNDGVDLPMTLGWHVGESDGFKYLFKEGGGAGFHSEMRMYLDKGISSVVMTNSTTFDVKGFLNRGDRFFK